MIRIVVEIVPGGFGAPKEIARGTIANISNLAPVSDYIFRFEAKDRDGNVSRRNGMVPGHPRSAPVLTLVRRALVHAGW